LPSGAQLIVQSLEKQNVEVIFGIPGGAIMIFYDRLRDSKIRHILMRHEQGAAHAADGYARASGRVGICSATSGPGATNLVTGIATAYMDSSPVIAITGQVPTSVIGSDAFQEVDIVGIISPVVKYAFQLKSAREIPIVFKKAFFIASSGRPGPVLIDVPKDVQQETIDEIEIPREVIVSGRGVISPDPDPIMVKKTAEILLNAERPLIICGGGVIQANASQDLLNIVESLQIPVVTTLMGKGAIPENHPLCMGMIGMHGKVEANKAIFEADVILAIGTRFSDRSTGLFSEFAKQAKVIHVDIDESEIDKNIEVDITINSDAKKFLRMLYSVLSSLSYKKDKTEWLKRIAELKSQYAHVYERDGVFLKPWRIFKIMREELPPDSIVTTGVGQNQMWAALHFPVYEPRTFITSGGLGTMGFGFPAALGAKAAKPDKHVVCVDGDGSFLMTSQNLATAVTENLPVVVVILDNRSLGMVRQWQLMFFNKRCTEVDLGSVPDIEKLAKAFGAEGFSIGDYEEFRSAFRNALRNEVCTIIDVPIHPDEKVLPMVPPGKPLTEVILE